MVALILARLDKRLRISVIAELIFESVNKERMDCWSFEEPSFLDDGTEVKRILRACLNGKCRHDSPGLEEQEVLANYD